MCIKCELLGVTSKLSKEQDKESALPVEDTIRPVKTNLT